MTRLRRMLQRPGVHVLLVCLFAILFCWPFLAPDHLGNLEHAYTYIFAIWGLAILVLFVLSRCVGSPPSAQRRRERSER